jgi:hypothetical protein
MSARQLLLFDIVPATIEHRGAKGRYSTYLQAALEEAARWRQLYVNEMTRKEYVAQTLRLQQEEINRLKNLH